MRYIITADVALRNTKVCDGEVSVSIIGKCSPLVIHDTINWVYYMVYGVYPVPI